MNSRTGKNGMSSIQVRRLTYSALYLAIAQVLPFVTGQIPEIGSMLCPMHIPALLCGFMCGGPWGLAMGFVAPLLRGVLFGMPVVFPTGIAMAFELAVYGSMTGWLFQALPHRKWAVYAALLLAMLSGRLVWGIVRLAFSGITGDAFTMAMFTAGAFTYAIPGIILQIMVVPVLVLAMNQAGLSLNT